MKTMQVFDCQDMPADVQENFFKQNEGVGNDVYISIYLTDFKNLSPEEYKEEYAYDDNEDGGVLYLQWLLDNGATDDKVLIKHWW